jgi:hypothetical protein
METKATTRAEFVLGPLGGQEDQISVEEDNLPPKVLWRPVENGRRAPYVRLHLALGRGWIYKYEPSVPLP